MERKKIANEIAAAINGKTWIKLDDDNNIIKCRVYGAKNGYCDINNDGVNIDQLKRTDFAAVQTYCNDNNISTYRA